jgi:antirestriction protein ArdC
MRNLYQEVSERIAHELERGAAPWIKPWSSTPGANVPMNAATNRPYSGCNVILLWIAQDRGWTSPRFLTFKQALGAGGCVRRGEHGTKVYFVKMLYKRGDKLKNGEIAANNITMLREYTVFNVAQCDGLSESVVNGKSVAVVRNPHERDATIDEFVVATKAHVVEGTDNAAYIPSVDRITIPSFKRFKGAAHFYGTLFHELGHWTAHKDRLNRDLKGRFGDKQYAAEELIAELTAAFLCAEFSLDGDLRHAGYIKDWITLLRDDAKAFFTAASAAQKAADYLRHTVVAEDTAEAA